MSKKMYADFGSSKQSFPNVRLFEAINGNLVLRGQNGERDHIYPLAKACKMFFRMFDTYSYWMLHGFATQCDEMKPVLYELGRKIQEAVAERLAGKADPPPAICDAKFMASLERALQNLNN